MAGLALDLAPPRSSLDRPVSAASRGCTHFATAAHALPLRKQLAALLSVRYGLAPGGLALLLEDDERCVVCLQRFLAEHHVPYELPFYDDEGWYLFAAPGKTEVLADALLRAVRRGRDNELFVLLADFLEIVEHLGPVLAAVKVARARHHQVIVVCPWPPGVPPPLRAARSVGREAWGVRRTRGR